MLEISPEVAADLQQLSIYLGVLVVVIWLLFANTVRKTLLLINEENRALLPNQAWFLAIPLFNIYWNFEVCRRLSISLNNEFYDRKISVEEMPTKSAGNRYSWCFLIYYLPLIPPFFRITLFILCIVYFISYWFKIAQHKSLIKEHDDWKQNHKDEN